MKSIDNLREWWRDRFPVMDRQLGCDFREHIDAIEFEAKALTDERDLLKTQWEAGVDFDQRLESCAENREDVTLFGVDYMAYPLDADGVPIHVGDVLDGYGKTIEVVELRIGRSGWVLISRDGNGYADCAAFTHHHAPTVEDVLREFASDIADVLGGDDFRLDDSDELFAEYAAKLRLAEGSE